jgi:hypothetical protein
MRVGGQIGQKVSKTPPISKILLKKWKELEAGLNSACLTNAMLWIQDWKTEKYL